MFLLAAPESPDGGRARAHAARTCTRFLLSKTASCDSGGPTRGIAGGQSSIMSRLPPLPPLFPSDSLFARATAAATRQFIIVSYFPSSLLFRHRQRVIYNICVCARILHVTHILWPARHLYIIRPSIYPNVYAHIYSGRPRRYLHIVFHEKCFGLTYNIIESKVVFLQNCTATDPPPLPCPL